MVQNAGPTDKITGLSTSGGKRVSMSRQGKIGRNDPCPCGSGLKYKKCHLDREQATPIPYHESAKQLLDLRVGSKKCLHPSKGTPCSGKVIRAHTISRSIALSKIGRVGMVYQLDANPFSIQKHEGKPPLRLVNIASATTFTGFCSAHDSELFEPIDKGTLVPTKEQIFLLHFRALCRELYVKRPIPATNELLRDADRGKPVDIQRMVQGYVTARGAAIDESLRQLEKDKLACDQARATADYRVLSGAFVHFRDTPTVACSGYTQPSFNFAGNEIQDVTDMSKPYLNLSFTLVPNGNGAIAVFTWLDDADLPCRAFVQSFMNLVTSAKLTPWSSMFSIRLKTLQSSRTGGKV